MLLMLVRLQTISFALVAAVDLRLILETNITVDGQFIAALFAGVVSVIATCVASYTAIIATRTKKIADATYTETKTLNAKSGAEILDSIPTQRIVEKQETGGVLTEEDHRHLDTVPARELEEVRAEVRRRMSLQQPAPDVTDAV